MFDPKDRTRAKIKHFGVNTINQIADCSLTKHWFSDVFIIRNIDKSHDLSIFRIIKIKNQIKSASRCIPNSAGQAKGI